MTDASKGTGGRGGVTNYVRGETTMEQTQEERYCLAPGARVVGYLAVEDPQANPPTVRFLPILFPHDIREPIRLRPGERVVGILQKDQNRRFRADRQDEEC